MGDSYNMDDFQKAIYNAVSVTRNTVCADCVVDVSDLSGTITGTGKLSLIYGEALLLFSVFWYFYTEESEKRKHLVTVAGGIVCLIVLLYRH